MTRYVVELYRPSSCAEPLRGDADRLRTSAAELVDEGTAVRYVGSIFLPGDETCLHVLDAPCEADVRALAELAAIEIDRVVPAEQIELGCEEDS
jgi:hypothetical protein